MRSGKAEGWAASSSTVKGQRGNIACSSFGESQPRDLHPVLQRPKTPRGSGLPHHRGGQPQYGPVAAALVTINAFAPLARCAGAALTGLIPSAKVPFWDLSPPRRQDAPGSISGRPPYCSENVGRLEPAKETGLHALCRCHSRPIPSGTPSPLTCHGTDTASDRSSSYSNTSHSDDNELHARSQPGLQPERIRLEV
jgi:hypothetical protein